MGKKLRNTITMPAQLVAERDEALARAKRAEVERAELARVYAEDIVPKWRYQLAEAETRAEKAEAEVRDINSALDDDTYYSKLRVRLAEAEKVIEAAARRLGYLGHTPGPQNPDYETYQELAAYRAHYPKES